MAKKYLFLFKNDIQTLKESEKEEIASRFDESVIFAYGSKNDIQQESTKLTICKTFNCAIFKNSRFHAIFKDNPDAKIIYLNDIPVSQYDGLTNLAINKNDFCFDYYTIDSKMTDIGFYSVFDQLVINKIKDKLAVAISNNLSDLFYMYRVYLYYKLLKIYEKENFRFDSYFTEEQAKNREEIIQKVAGVDLLKTIEITVKSIDMEKYLFTENFTFYFNSLNMKIKHMVKEYEKFNSTVMDTFGNLITEERIKTVDTFLSFLIDYLRR